MISNFSMPVKSFSATDSIGTVVIVNRYVSTVRPSEIEIGIPVSISPNSSAKMIHALVIGTPASLSATGMRDQDRRDQRRPARRVGGDRGERAALMACPRATRRRMQVVGQRVGVDVRSLDALDVRDVVVRQLAGARERPRDLQEAEAHQVRAERDAQVDDPLRHLEVGRHRVGVRDVPDEGRAERADDAGERGARERGRTARRALRVSAGSRLIITSTPTWMPVRTP